MEIHANWTSLQGHAYIRINQSDDFAVDAAKNVFGLKPTQEIGGVCDFIAPLNVVRKLKDYCE